MIMDKTGTMRPVVMLRVLRVTEDWAQTPHTHRALSSRAQPSTGTRCTQGKQSLGKLCYGVNFLLKVTSHDAMVEFKICWVTKILVVVSLEPTVQ